MWEWCDKLKLGKSASAFVKRAIRSLPLTDAEIEADFFLDLTGSDKHQERWVGMVVERESGALLAEEDVRLPPPTVNSLANLLAQAMLRPGSGDGHRPRRIHLRDRSQWQELLPHLRQLGMEVALQHDLPWFDEAAIECACESKTKKSVSADAIQIALRKPFPARKRAWFTEAMVLTQWSHAMFQGAYPSREVPFPPYAPETVVPISLTAEELKTVLTRTSIAKTKKLRLRLEAMAAEGQAIELEITGWCDVVRALCGARAKEDSIHQQMVTMATRIASGLAEALKIEPPNLSV